jgi:hypothetical protein
MKKQEVLRYLMFIFVFLLFLSSVFCPVNSSAAETTVLKGRVNDIKGSPVEGAEIFVYNTLMIRRPADFISPKTDSQGIFLMSLPSGKYWIVARTRKEGETGPLMPGDKHSPETKEIELLPGSELHIDFVVTDLKEAFGSRTRSKENYFRIEGRILDENRVPVGMAYVFADKNREVSGLPDYLSAWTDTDGHYLLYLPRGKYFIGALREFPPSAKLSVNKEIIVDKDNTGLDIISMPKASDKGGK